MFDEQVYEGALRAARERFDTLYLKAFRDFAPQAELGLSEDEAPYFGVIEWPALHPEDGRDARFRYAVPNGNGVTELAYRFGVRLEPREADGEWNFGKTRRRVTAEVLPLRQELRLSAFVFEDRGGLGDADRHGRGISVVPVSLVDGEWDMASLIRHLWSRALLIRSDDLLPEPLYVDLADEVRLVPLSMN